MGGRGGSSGKGSSGAGTTVLGTLTRTYPDGTKRYEKSGAVLSNEEAKTEFRLMSDVISNEFVRGYNSENKNKIRKSDVEFDKNTGNITVWTGNDPSKTGNWNMGVKLFYATKVTGTKVTDVSTDGKKEVRFKDTKYKFQIRGSKN